MTTDRSTAVPRQDRARRVTSVDVAREAGVSRTTVSYVLNNKEGLSIPEATRDRVRAAAARLGYAPSAAARALRTGRSDVVLVLLPHRVVSAVTESFLDTLTQLLTAHGLTLLVYHGQGHERPGDVWRAVNPRAVISDTPFSPGEERELRQWGIQALTTLRSHEATSTNEQASTQESIGRLQVQYLTDTGHTSIAYATTSDMEQLSEYANPRLAGARRESAAKGIAEPVVAAVDLNVDTARSTLAAWRSLTPPVTAIAAYNDEVAIALLTAAHLEGIRVPRDLAVIGVDNIRVGCLVHPPLTTVQLAEQDEARYLADRILNPTAAHDRPAEILSVLPRGTT